MKAIIKFLSAGAVVIALCAGFWACNEHNGQAQSDEQRRIELAQLTDEIYYVNGCWSSMLEFQEDGTIKCGAYLFISENLQDTVCVYNVSRKEGTEWGEPGKLFDGIFEFPSDVIPSYSIRGFNLFSNTYRLSYPVKINSHRPMNENETLYPIFYNSFHIFSTIHANKYIVVESLTKLN